MLVRELILQASESHLVASITVGVGECVLRKPVSLDERVENVVVEVRPHNACTVDSSARAEVSVGQRVLCAGMQVSCSSSCWSGDQSVHVS